MVMRRKETENEKFGVAPLNGRQSIWVFWKGAKVEEHMKQYRTTSCKVKFDVLGAKADNITSLEQLPIEFMSVI